ncbi:MAG TPA: hypothetical protein VFU31_05780 [Candidatus Binatia bacterium]|nr:hypothetical protein [Candidatus Binatia bacterium]
MEVRGNKLKTQNSGIAIVNRFDLDMAIPRSSEATQIGGGV